MSTLFDIDFESGATLTSLGFTDNVDSPPAFNNMAGVGEGGSRGMSSTSGSPIQAILDPGTQGREGSCSFWFHRNGTTSFRVWDFGDGVTQGIVLTTVGATLKISSHTGGTDHVTGIPFAVGDHEIEVGWNLNTSIGSGDGQIFIAIDGVTRLHLTGWNSHINSGQWTSVRFNGFDDDAYDTIFITNRYGLIDVVADPPPPIDPYPDPTVTYEAPCAIRNPIIWGVVQTLQNPSVPGVYDLQHFAIKPLRDDATYYGGWKSGRLQAYSSFPRVASDWLTGSIEAQGGSVTLIDTDHKMRTAVEAHGGSLIGSRVWLYLISERGRLLQEDPRLIATGLVTEDPLDAHLTYALPFRDTLGTDFINLLAGDTMIPQRHIEADFPGYGLTGTDTGTVGWLGAPIIAGTNSDEAAAVPGGKVPLIYGGTMLCRDGVTRHLGILCGHPVAGGIINGYDNTENQPDADPPTAPVPLEWGVNAWAPGKPGWSTVNPDGVALYTAVNDRWYTLVFLDDTLGLAFKNKSASYDINTPRFESNGDGSGTEITNFHDQHLHVLLNFMMNTPGWQSGAWLTSPPLEFYPGGDVYAMVDIASWLAAKAESERYHPGGFRGAFVLGHNGVQQSMRTVIAEFNVQGHVRLGINRYGQYFVKMLTTDRNAASTDIRTVTEYHDTLNSAPLTARVVPDLLINNLRAIGGMNYRTNEYELRAQIGDAPSFVRFGSRGAEPETYTLLQDGATGLALMRARLAFRAVPRRIVGWRESRCGLRHQVLDYVKVRHSNGPGAAGYVDRICWIQLVRQNPDSSVDLEAVDIDDLLTTLASASAPLATLPSGLAGPSSGISGPGGFGF